MPFTANSMARSGCSLSNLPRAISLDLLRVEHHDVIAHVDVRREDGLVLALEAHGDLRAETAEHLVGRIDDEPVTAHSFGLRKNSTHY